MSAYHDATVAFGTRHGKQHQVADAFAVILGAHVTAPDDLDTDQFGTFSGEVPRTGSPPDALRAKATLALQVTGLPLALASEASYGPLPGLSVTVHEEVLLFRDTERGIEVIEGERGPLTLPGPVRVATVDEAAPFLDRAGFGDQAVIVRPAAGDATSDIHKGITDTATLATAVRRAAQRSADGRALLEPDLRAHHNPTRRDVLRRLGERMARRLATACPACSCPGYGRTSTEPGLPCAAPPPTWPPPTGTTVRVARTTAACRGPSAPPTRSGARAATPDQTANGRAGSADGSGHTHPR